MRRTKKTTAKVTRNAKKTVAEVATLPEIVLPNIEENHKDTRIKALKAENGAGKISVDNGYIAIDHPKELETIMQNGNYTVRIGASPCKTVEISLDGKDWTACRNSVGYWWFDLNGITTGEHSFIVRMQETGGEYLSSKPRHFKVA